METRIEIVRYRGRLVDLSVSSEKGFSIEAFGLDACWSVKDDVILVQAAAHQDVEDFGIDLVLDFPGWQDAYVLVPGAVYDGNRFSVLEAPYPPMYPTEEDDRTLITDVPRLPVFHLLSGDASVPALGLWNRSEKMARAILFPAVSDLDYLGLRVEATAKGLTVRIQFPGVRPVRYTMVDTQSPSADRGTSVGKGWSMKERVVVVGAEASEVDGLFRLIDGNRHRAVAAGKPKSIRPFSSVAGLVHDVTMRTRWQEMPGYFETADSDRGIPFQVGWTGGGITSFAISESGDPIAKARARRNVDFVCESLQGGSGFFCGGFGAEIVNDGFGHPHAAHWAMVRKNGDFLLYLMRHILATDDAPALWTEAARRCAEAFARNAPAWGQFVDVRDGCVVVGGSTCGGTALAGMALAASVFQEPGYLEAARSAGEHYAHPIEQGILTGGPGEILKAPDSESAFGLVEGYIVLWETTGESHWLGLAERAARQAASWTVPYDFPFPEKSTFGGLGMRTTGTIIANVQNKHSAPGICTLSSLSLLKLYRATGDRRWLDLAVEISHALPQYVSSAERPISATDGCSMPSGWVNERVNMSDWEVPECGVGEIFYGPCWSMTSVLLTALEMPGVYIDVTGGIVACADHVEAHVEDGFVRIKNATPFDAVVRVLIDRDRSKPLGEGWWRKEPLVVIPAGGVDELPL